MTILARPLCTLADRSPAARRLTLTLAALAAAILALLAGAASSRAVIVEVGGAKAGIDRHSAPSLPFVGEALESEGVEPAKFANAAGNPVLHGNSTYVVYWDPGDLYHDDWQGIIDKFMENMSKASGQLASVFAVDAQYTDKSNQPAKYSTAFRVASTDTTPYPGAGCKDPKPLGKGDAVTCLTDKQVRHELESFISTHLLPKGMNPIYYVLVPPGVTVCLDEGASASHCSSNAESPSSFCSYHAAITPTSPETGDGNTILYAVIPWSAGTLGDPLLHNEADASMSGDNCLDGGYDPSSKPIAEKHEKKKEKTEKEKEEFEKKTKEEQEKQKKTEELEGPHQQEPNQTTCPTVYDGGCDTGLADIIINQIAVETQNVITDPLLNAWHDPSGNESVDECKNVFALVEGGSVQAQEASGAGTLYNQSLGENHYYLNDAFNAAAYLLPQPGTPCLQHVNLAPSFTVPTPVNSGEIVGFDGMESNIALNAAIDFPGGGTPSPTYAFYHWNFGDGSPIVAGFAPGAPPCEIPWLSPCAASVFHAYTYGGTYQVTLAVTDVAGNTASLTQSIKVNGPPPPSAEGGGASGSGGSSASGGSTAAATKPPPPPPPLAAQAVLNHSLRRAVHKGLMVSYSVNEQVAGRFELLLERSLAQRLGIAGPAAAGLPAGSAPAVVIGKAVLVTTAGGRSAVKIEFSKRTAARLARLHKVTLSLRLIVRNAPSHGSGTTTVLSTFTLSG